MPGNLPFGAVMSKHLLPITFPAASLIGQLGKLLPVIKAVLEVSLPTPPKKADGLAGQIEGPSVLTHCPMTGVQGKPVWKVAIVLTCHPPRTAPRASLRFLKMGRSQTASAAK